MKRTKTVASFCDGSSTAQYILNLLFGSLINIDYHAWELDMKAQLLTNKLFPNTHQHGDVRNWRKTINPVYADWFFAGTSCTSTSGAGKRAGFCTKDGRKVKTLEQYIQFDRDGIEMNESCVCFWESVWYMKVIKPKYFFFEIPPLSKEWYDIFERETGVKGVMLDASLFSAQVRKRWYFTNVPIERVVSDMNITLSDRIPGATGWGIHGTFNPDFGVIPGVKKWSLQKVNLNKEGKSYTITTKGGRYILLDGTVHSYTVSDLEWLMGFPEGHTEVLGLTKGDRKRILGNGWSVPVVKHILSGLAYDVSPELKKYLVGSES